MFCSSCGKKNDEDSEFCQWCGASMADTDDAVMTRPSVQYAVPNKKAENKKKNLAFIIIAILFFTIAVSATCVVYFWSGITGYLQDQGIISSNSIKSDDEKETTTKVKKAEETTKSETETATQPTTQYNYTTVPSTYTPPTYSPTPTVVYNNYYVATQKDDLFIRSGPGQQYPDVGRLSKGTQVYISGLSPDRAWGSLVYNGVSGWVSMQYMALI